MKWYRRLHHLCNKLSGGITHYLVLSFGGINLIWLMLCYLGFYYVGRWTRVVALAITLLLSNLPILLCALYRPPRWLWEFSSVQGCVGFWVALHLCESSFSSTFTDADVMILGLSVALILCYITRSTACMMLYYVFLRVGMMGVDFPISNGMYVLMLLLTVPFGVLIYQERGVTKSFHTYLSVASIMGLLYFEDYYTYSNFGIWLYVIFAYLVLLYLLDMRINGKEKPYYCRPLRIICCLGCTFTFAIGSRSGVWEQRLVMDQAFDINMALFAILVVMCIFYVERIMRERITLEEILVCAYYYISFVVYIFHEFYASGAGQIMEYWFALTMLLMCLMMWGKLWKYHSPYFHLVPGVLLLSYLYLAYGDGRGEYQCLLFTLAGVTAFTALGILDRRKEKAV